MKFTIPIKFHMYSTSNCHNAASMYINLADVHLDP